MAINMVRQPSAEPNIENIDDIIPFRYAYGNQNGYVKNFGTEIDYTLSGSSFILTSGRMVVQGVEVDIDDGGFEIPLDISKQKRYYLIYLKVDMTKNVEGGKVASIVATYDNYVYPELPQSEDLSQNNKGVAYLGLYRFEITNGIVEYLEQVVLPIEYINKDTEIKNATNVTGTIAGNEIEEIFEKDGVTATKAKNVIDNGDGTRSGFVKDNNVLKVEDEIIARRRLFWSDALITSSIRSTFSIGKNFENKKYLFVWQADDYQFETIVDMSKLSSHTNPAFAQFFSQTPADMITTMTIRTVHFSPILNSNIISIYSGWYRPYSNAQERWEHWQISVTKIYEIID